VLKIWLIVPNKYSVDVGVSIWYVQYVRIGGDFFKCFWFIQTDFDKF